MELVINKCYGGFGLSPYALQRIQELKGEPCFFFDYDFLHKQNGYTQITIDEANTAFMFQAFKVENPAEYLGNEKDWYEMNKEEKKNYNDKFNNIHIDTSDYERNDPLLVQVVKELGEKANDKHASLSIIEIPDGIEFEIEEYDGMEWVSEKHQTWS